VYVPRFTAVQDEDDIREMVAMARTAWLVTVGDDAVPVGTLLPIMWRENTVVAHMAKANSQWRQMKDNVPALLIISGPEAYISPSWYAAKAEHGKVVPTWHYTAVHLTGTVCVHVDREWLRAAVVTLTELHEKGRERPWEVADAPERYVDGLLRGIVGIEFTVTGVEAKAKLSQDRSQVDQGSVIEGLRGEAFPGAQQIAAAMSHGGVEQSD
jgi:transcriptional regulator